ncbi:MAG: glyceraldehyde-3-phosphate dehydrogenase [Pseudomonadota bacterium]
MTIRVAINGYGRIGRMVLRAIYEENRTDLQVVAINGLGGIDINAHLTQYDSAHGKFNASVSVDGNYLVVNGDRIRVYSTRNPLETPWGEHQVDVVLECSGAFTTKEKAMVHISQGAKKVLISAPKVLISAPGGDDVDATIVYGVNHQVLKASDQVVSNASCTTNCLAPLVKPLLEQIGIDAGLMTTIHSYTNDQVLTDVYHQDMRRARSATMSLIPTKTGAAKAVGLVLPALKGKFDGFAMRVPTINVSVVDLTFTASRKTSVEEVNQILKKASESDLSGILWYNTLPLVSIDFNHNPYPSIFDSTQTRVSNDGRLVKVLSWYDNEWGYSIQMLNATSAMMHAS